MGLFGKDAKADPKEQVREWSRKLRHEQRALDRQINGIQREENKVKRQIKDAAKKGDRDVCKILAKEIVQSRKTISKLHTSKAQINSVVMGMQQQAASIRLAGSLQASTEVMKSMQSLIKLPEISATMRELSKEMMKAGIIEEMLEDTMETMEPEDMEEEVQNEVDKVLFEITAGELGKAPAAPVGSVSALPGEEEEVALPGPSADVDSEPEEMDQMRERLEALRS